jgi:dGTPase
MVKDVITNTKNNLRLNKIDTINDVYKAKKIIVKFSNKMNLFDLSIKKFLKEKMYYSKSVLKKTHNGKKIVKSLFKIIKKDPKKFIKLENIKNSTTERAISDFIAGMTDRYAINLYNDKK